MRLVVDTLKPTIPKCVGAVLVAAFHYCGNVLIFMVAVTLKVFKEPAIWTKMAEEFRKSSIAVEGLVQSFGQELVMIQILFDLVTGYL